MATVYHLTTESAWAAAPAADAYYAESLATEGFIHASTMAQVVASANRFFGGHATIVVLAIDLDRVAPPVRWERSPHSPNPFPHLYGPLNLNAVVGVAPWARSADGSFRWPPDGPTA